VRQIETEIDISAAPERVWAVLTDFAKYPSWNPFIREIEGTVAAGERLRVRIYPPEGSPMSFRPTIQHLSPGKELRWLGHLFVPGLFDGEHSFKLDTVGGAGVRFGHGEVFRGLLVPLFPESMYARTRRGFDEMNQALKREAEKPE
jgi:hypothetical protein